MPWQCFLVKSLRQSEWQPTEGGGRMRHTIFTLEDGREVTFKELPVGAMWRASQEPQPGPENHLCVVLPGKEIWHMHDKGSDGCQWTITGEPPLVTASPSINFVGRYHGYVQNGFVTDDVDGRKFDPETGKAL